MYIENSGKTNSHSREVAETNIIYTARLKEEVKGSFPHHQDRLQLRLPDRTSRSPFSSTRISLAWWPQLPEYQCVREAAPWTFKSLELLILAARKTSTRPDDRNSYNIHIWYMQRWDLSCTEEAYMVSKWKDEGNPLSLDTIVCMSKPACFPTTPRRPVNAHHVENNFNSRKYLVGFHIWGLKILPHTDKEPEWTKMSLPTRKATHLPFLNLQMPPKFLDVTNQGPCCIVLQARMWSALACPSLLTKSHHLYQSSTLITWFLLQWEFVIHIKGIADRRTPYLVKQNDAVEFWVKKSPVATTCATSGSAMQE